MTKVIGLFLLLAANYSFAGYDANLRGVLNGVYVYTSSDYLYIKLTKQPATHPCCSPDYFVIPSSVPYERRQMLLSSLLMAYASKESVNIGYDSRGEWAHGYIMVYRVG